MKQYSERQIIFEETTKKQEDTLNSIVNNREYCYSNAIRGKSDIVRQHFDESLKKFKEDMDSYEFRKEVG